MLMQMRSSSRRSTSGRPPKLSLRPRDIVLLVALFLLPFIVGAIIVHFEPRTPQRQRAQRQHHPLP